MVVGGAVGGADGDHVVQGRRPDRGPRPDLARLARPVVARLARPVVARLARPVVARTSASSLSIALASTNGAAPSSVKQPKERLSTCTPEPVKRTSSLATFQVSAVASSRVSPGRTSSWTAGASHTIRPATNVAWPCGQRRFASSDGSSHIAPGPAT